MLSKSAGLLAMVEQSQKILAEDQRWLPAMATENMLTPGHFLRPERDISRNLLKVVGHVQKMRENRSARTGTTVGGTPGTARILSTAEQRNVTQRCAIY